MYSETYICEIDILNRIKMNNQLSIEDKAEFNKVTKTLYMNQTGRDRLSVVKIKNQARNKMKKEAEDVAQRIQK